MAAHFIFSYDINDQESYSAYVPGVVPLLQKYGGEILVADYAAKTVEGEPRGVNVVSRFESEEVANAMYSDPAYQPFKKLRLASTTGTALLAQDFSPPGA